MKGKKIVFSGKGPSAFLPELKILIATYFSSKIALYKQFKQKEKVIAICFFTDRLHSFACNTVIFS